MTEKGQEKITIHVETHKQNDDEVELMEEESIDGSETEAEANGEASNKVEDTGSESDTKGFLPFSLDEQIAELKKSIENKKKKLE